jgi:polar amino acid transport system substrate-binding protein
MVEWRLVADSTIRNLKVKGVKRLSPPILVQPLYMYVQKKHRALVPELSKALRQMKADGFFDKVAGKKAFVFYTGAQSPVKDILEGRLQEAFKRIGLKFELVFTGSAQRALVMANEDGDGDASRVPAIKQIAPKDTENLIRIPEAIGSIKFFVYTRGKVSAVNGFKSLGDFRNGFRVGTKILEKNIPGERIMLPDASRLFRMLDDGRLDAVVERVFIADKILKENDYPGITRLTPPLVDLPTYSFIQKKYKALIPEIAEALKQMKADGTFEKIGEDVLRKYQLN